MNVKKSDFKKLSVIDSFKLILSDEAPFGNPVCTNPNCECYLKYDKKTVAKDGVYRHKSSGYNKKRFKCKKCGTRFFLHPFGFEKESDFKDKGKYEFFKVDWSDYRSMADLSELYSVSEETIRKFLRLAEIEYRHKIRDSFFINEASEVRVLEYPIETISESISKKMFTVFFFFDSNLNIINFAVIPSSSRARERLLQKIYKFLKNMPFNSKRNSFRLSIQGPSRYHFANPTSIAFEATFNKLKFPDKWIYQVLTLGHLKAKMSLFAMVYNNHLIKQRNIEEASE